MNGIVSFLGYSLREINFSKNDYFKGGKVNLDLKISKNSTYIDNKRVRMNLNVKLFSNVVDNNYPFTLAFVISGLFQYREINIEVDNNRELIEKMMIDILYPYIRTIVTSILTTANMPPLFLPTINVNQLIKNNKTVN
jgi:preprotein translocase subunit SecB